MKMVQSYAEEKAKILELPGMSVDNIMGSVKEALVETQQVMETSGIKIKRIDLTLKAIASGDAGTQIKLNIPILGELKLGSAISSKSVQTIFISLKPLKPETRTKDMNFPELGERLKESILALSNGVMAAVNSDPPLEVYESSVELNFILTSESEISLIIKSGFESELTNNLKIIFEKI
jgi:hypothetical protein